jgi:hypothetical protein
MVTRTRLNVTFIRALPVLFCVDLALMAMNMRGCELTAGKRGTRQCVVVFGYQI